VQYGPGVLAFAVYMTQYQLLPYQHTAEVLNERAGLGTSPGILQRAVRVAATRLETTANAIRRALVAAPVAHADETGRRVNDTILTEAEAEAGNFPCPRRPGTRGRIKQSPAGNLIRRLREHRNEVLRFLTDLRVPCDNNQAECDLRMPKLKQKVSGCFRSDTGGDAFAILRSCLSTRRKQSDGIFNSLVLTFQGQPPMPQLE